MIRSNYGNTYYKSVEGNKNYFCLKKQKASLQKKNHKNITGKGVDTYIWSLGGFFDK